MANRGTAAKLDWNRLLGFEQIAPDRAAIRDSRIASKVGVKLGVKIGVKIGGKLGVKIGVKTGLKG
jgi:hypothetical protein